MRDTFLLMQNKYRYSTILLREIVKTDFKLRYQGSFLGYIWSLLKPLFMFAILYLVFGVVFNAGATIPHFPVYLLLGILLWNYFTEVANNSVSSIVDKGDLLRKLNFPKYVIILAGSASALINLVINFSVVAIFMLIGGIDLHWSVLFLPMLILQLFVLSLGTAFLLSALYVKFRDIGYIWEIMMQAAFYLTPILYPISFVIERSPEAAKLLLLNPMAQIIQDARYALVTHDTMTFEQIFDNGWYRAIPVALTLVIVVVGAWYFKKQSPSFAEEV